VNAELVIKKGYSNDAYKVGTRVYEFTTSVALEDNLVRVYSPTASIKQAGSWVMEKASLEGLSAEAIAKKFSLPSVPTHITDVKIPSGVRLRKGVPAHVMLGKGDASVAKQIEIVDPLQPSWFTNAMPLE
jgi:hypothetical protein